MTARNLLRKLNQTLQIINLTAKEETLLMKKVIRIKAHLSKGEPFYFTNNSTAILKPISNARHSTSEVYSSLHSIYFSKTLQVLI